MNNLLKEVQEYVDNNRINNTLNYHITPKIGWLNDPNGLVFYKGEYHVFYQTYPFDIKNTNIYWGHVKSKDLIHWEECPIALAPDEYYDQNGCFTGSAIVVNDELWLMYTGHRLTEDSYVETQNIAISKDGINFTKINENPLIEESPISTTHRFRDPKVWKKDGKYYVVIGAENTENDGKVVMFESDDLRNFEYVGVMAESDGTLGEVWECPNFVTIDGYDILIISPKGLKVGDSFNYGYESGYLIGSYDYKSHEFKHEEYEKLDYGHDFYAPQIFQDDKNRTILFAWFGVPEAKLEEVVDGWANALTLPRELYVNENKRLCMKPVDELKNLRKEKIIYEDITIENEYRSLITKKCVEIVYSISNIEDTVSKVGISIKVGESILVEIYFDPKRKEMLLDRRGIDGIRKAYIGDKKNIAIRIFVDKSTIEVFVNEGEVVFSSRIYPKSPLTYYFISESGKSNGVIEAYELENVW